MNKEMMEIMVNDWLTDNAEEMDDMIIDGEAYYSEELECWCMDCHDSITSYMLTEDGHGNVSIN